MFVLQNTPQSELQLPGLTLSSQKVSHNTAQFDLTLSLQESQEQIVGGFNYASDLFDRATVERWAEHFRLVLSAMVSGADRQIKDLSLLGDIERDRLLHEFNATEVEYPQGKAVHQLFEDQVERSEQSVAVVYEGQSVSYGD